MKQKGFTLIELLIVIVIIAALGGLVFGGVRGCSFDDSDTHYNPVWYPEAAHAQAEQEQANELRRANDLKERELNMREAETRKVEE